MHAVHIKLGCYRKKNSHSHLRMHYLVMMVEFHLTFIVPITSTHSHTSLTHTWTGGTHLCPSHLHSQPHLPHLYLDTLKKIILNQSSCKEYHRPLSC